MPVEYHNGIDILDKTDSFFHKKHFDRISIKHLKLQQYVQKLLRRIGNITEV